MIFLASDSRKYVCVKIAGYDISGKFWDLTELPLQQDFGLTPLKYRSSPILSQILRELVGWGREMAHISG